MGGWGGGGRSYLFQAVRVRHFLSSPVPHFSSCSLFRLEFVLSFPGLLISTLACWAVMGSDRAGGARSHRVLLLVVFIVLLRTG